MCVCVATSYLHIDAAIVLGLDDIEEALMDAVKGSHWHAIKGHLVMHPRVLCYFLCNLQASQADSRQRQGQCKQSGGMRSPLSLHATDLGSHMRNSSCNGDERPKGAARDSFK